MTLVQQSPLSAWHLMLASIAAASLAICCVGLCIERSARGQSAPLRHAILVTCLLLAMVSPALLLAAQSAGFHGWVINRSRVLVESPTALGEANSATTATSDNATTKTDAHDVASHLATKAERINAEAKPDSPSLPSPAISKLKNAESWRMLTTAVTIAWGAGSLVCLVRFARGLAIIRTLRRTLHSPSDATLVGLMSDAFAAIGARPAAPIFESDVAPAPLSFGLWHPVVVMPTGLTEALDREQLRLVLRHEAAHIARGDQRIAFVQCVAEVVFWWNPILRRLNRHIARLREQICDDYATADAATPADRRQLADVLITIAGWEPPVRLTVAGTTALLDDARDDLAARVTRLIESSPRALRLSRRGLCAIATLVAALVAIVPLTLVRGEDAARQDAGDKQQAASNSAKSNEVEAAVSFGISDQPELLAELRTLGVTCSPNGVTRKIDVTVMLPVNDAAMARLRQLNKVGSIILMSDRVTDNGMKFIAELRELTKLTINGSHITDAGIASLANHPALREITIFRRDVTDAGLAHLATMPNLTRMELIGCTITDDGLLKFHQASLTDVTIVGPDAKIGTRSMEMLAALPGLKALRIDNVGGEGVTDAGLAALSRCAMLERLDLHGDTFTDAGLDEVARMPRLRELTLNNRQITPAGIRRLKAAPELTALLLRGCPQIDDDALKAVGELTDLQFLALGGDSMTDEGLKHIATLTKLRTLWLENPRFTGDGLRYLTHFEKLSELMAHGVMIGNETLANIDRFPKLRVLNIGAGQPTDNPRVTDAGLRMIKSAPSLEVIFFFGTGLTNACLPSLETLPRLNTVHFNWSPGITVPMWHRQRPFAAPTIDRANEFLSFDDKQAVIWLYRGDKVMFALFHRGFLQDGVVLTTYNEYTWNYKGHVHILDKRKFALAYDSDDPDTIELDGHKFTAKDGRVIVLNVEGDPVQLDVTPPAPTPKGLPVLAGQIDAALKNRRAADGKAPTNAP